MENVELEKQSVPFTIKTHKHPWLWGTRMTYQQGYEEIINNGENFEFCFKRLFENENKRVVYQNIGIDKMLTLKKYLHLIIGESKEEWIMYYELYVQLYDIIYRKEMDTHK